MIEDTLCVLTGFLMLPLRPRVAFRNTHTSQHRCSLAPYRATVYDSNSVL